MLYVTLMPLKPLRTSLSMPRMPWTSMSPSSVAETDFSWISRFCATAATPAVRQLARPTSTYSTGVDAVVLGREELGMVGVEAELGLVALLVAEAEEALHRVAAVGAVHPLARRPPLELRRLGRGGERLTGVEQCLDVDAVVDGGVGRGHRSVSLSGWLVVLVDQSRQRRAGDDGQLGEAAQHESVAVAPVQLVAGTARRSCGEATQQGPERELALHASERRAEAEVDAVSEREVASVRSIEIERVGVRVVPASRFAAARQMMTCAPAGIVTSPMSTGSTA